MFTRLSRYLFGRETKFFGLTKDELERVDMDFDETDPDFDYERLIIKDGRPFGISATISGREITETEASVG